MENRGIKAKSKALQAFEGVPIIVSDRRKDHRNRLRVDLLNEREIYNTTLSKQSPGTLSWVHFHARVITIDKAIDLLDNSDCS